MSEKKNHNSLIFITTLSVYLGLVLVGSSPAVLAQAATTRSFDIKSEIVVEDDLDKKPEGDLFADEIVALIENLDRLAAADKFDWNAESNLTIEDLGFCESDDSPAYSGSKSGNVSDEAERSFQLTSLAIGRKLIRTKSDFDLGDYYSGWPEGVSFGLTVSKKNVNLETTIRLKASERTVRFSSLIDAYFLEAGSVSSNSGARIVAENTKSKVVGNAVVLVTHLPRASIDELLAR